MVERDRVGAQFTDHRGRLRAVAQRILGSATEAEDAVQEAWLRISRADTDAVENMAAWSTTVVARVCLNMLEYRRARPEEASGALPPEPRAEREPSGPEDEALLADSVGVALMVVLDTLSPAERLAFVLHDVFAVSFGEIGEILGRTPTATRQLASRARRRIRGAAGDTAAARSPQREIVDAFLAASRAGDFTGLLELLHPEAVSGEARGARAVAEFFAGRAQAARLALVDGVPAAVWCHRGRPRAVFHFTVVGARITRITVESDAARLAELDIVVLPARRRLDFVTDDCDATFEHLEATGAEVIQEPITRPDGSRDCAFLDPSGNILRFSQRVPLSP
ncbi:sigma-70 family RNA polymerase sigma factor [Nocardia sp. NPDC003482]